MFRRHFIMTLGITLLMAGLMCSVVFRAGNAEGAEGQSLRKEAGVGYLDNGQIRIGVNLDLGGAITYLSKSGSDTNLINSFDWGRQIQMSHYCGPIPFAPNGKQPQKGWAGLGWNPIQSGDCFGNRSKIVDYKNDGKTIYVKCIPMQWPLNNEPGECTFECWLQLEGETAHVRSRMVNHRSDKTQFSGRDQELPAVYTNGPWYRLMTYKGDKPFTNEAVSQIPSQFPWAGWQATENWAALVNDDGWGLGIWQPGVTTFIGGFAGKPGAGGPKDGPTGYIAPLYQEIIDHNIEYEYRYVLILGKLDAIRRYVYSHASPSTLPAYRFEKDRRHWHYINAVDAGWPIQGELKVLLEKDDPQLLGPSGLWMAEKAPKLKIEAAFHTGQTRAIVFWRRHDATEFAESRSLSFETIPDGKYHAYTIDLSASPEYRGAITRLRIDPEPSGRPGDYVKIKAISLEPSHP